MKNLPLLLVTILGSLALVVVVAMMFSKSVTQTQTADPAILVREARLTKGPQDNPKVTIVEFSDLQCPACKAVSPLVSKVQAAYPDQVRVVYRHYPLIEIHAYATLAAQAAEAAHQQGKFWEMHDLLFERQEVWAKLGSDAEVQAEFVKYAEELAIDKQKFLETIQSEAVKEIIAKDVADGNQVGVAGTPTIYVNGEYLPAPNQLQATVEALLQK